MSLVALLGRFTLAYLFLLVAIAIGLHLIGIPSSSGTNTAALLGAVMWACHAFARRNGRYLTRAERRSIFVGMLTVDLLLQWGIILLASTGKASALPLAATLSILAFVAVLHALTIWVMIGIAGKQYAKEAARARQA